MSTNQGPEYFAAEKRYLLAITPEERIFWLKEMIHNFKKHKGSENMLANLKTRLIKLEEKQEKAKKSGKGKKGIKKEGFQCVLVGLPNSGKSCLLSKLTNAKPEISPNPFTTKQPIIGTMYHEGFKIQIVDLPSIGSEYFDIGIINTADCLLIVLSSLDELSRITPLLSKATKNQIIIINKSDILSTNEKRILHDKLKSKKINGIILSCELEEGLNNLKGMIISSTNLIRIYTKEPGKHSTGIPVILPSGSTVRDVAESILKGFSQKVKETILTGPSSKFPNQKVGINHVLKDKDVVEFKTR